MAQLRFTKLVDTAVTPVKGSAGAAGYDLAAAFEMTLIPKQVGVVRTGLAFKFPEGTYGRVAPRSGLSLRNIDVAAGVIDSDYCGEVSVVLHNHSEDYIKINVGQRIAQLVVTKIEMCSLKCDDSLRTRVTERQDAGFGSTGQ